MAPHSSTLAWRIPGTGEPGGLLSIGSHRVGYDWSDLAVAAEMLGISGYWFYILWLYYIHWLALVSFWWWMTHFIIQNLKIIFNITINLLSRDAMGLREMRHTGCRIKEKVTLRVVHPCICLTLKVNTSLRVRCLAASECLVIFCALGTSLASHWSWSYSPEKVF